MESFDVTECFFGKVKSPARMVSSAKTDAARDIARRFDRARTRPRDIRADLRRSGLLHGRAFAAAALRALARRDGAGAAMPRLLGRRAAPRADPRWRGVGHASYSREFP